MQNLENLNREELTVDIVWANMVGLLILIPIALLYGIPYFFIWHAEFTSEHIHFTLEHLSLGLVGLDLGGFLLVLVGGIVVHELLHGLVWAFFTPARFRSIRFGVIWKMLTPYCHCKEPLKVSHYIMGALAPGLLLGVLPGIISILIGSIGLLLFAVFFTMAAAGDFLMVYLQ